MAGGRGALYREDRGSKTRLTWRGVQWCGWTCGALYPYTGVRPCERPSLQLSHTSRGVVSESGWGGAV